MVKIGKIRWGKIVRHTLRVGGGGGGSKIINLYVFTMVLK